MPRHIVNAFTAEVA